MSQLFTYGSHPVRTLTENGEAWFVAADVCKVLGISWRGNTLDCIPEAWKGLRSFRTLSCGTRGGGNQSLRFISEPAVYKLAFRSNKPEADAFTNWVASEVLPAIRKTEKFEAGSDGRAKPAQAELPPAPESPRMDKYEAYIEEVEAFRATTMAGIDRLIRNGLDLMDVYRFGPAPFTPYNEILLRWLMEVVVHPSALFDNGWRNTEYAIAHSPIGLVRELEKRLPDMRK